MVRDISIFLKFSHVFKLTSDLKNEANVTKTKSAFKLVSCPNDISMQVCRQTIH